MPRSADEKAGMCVRERGNWGNLQAIHKFDGKSFDKERFLKDIPKASPKLVKLLEKIKEVDTKDMAKHKHKFKHFIYSDMKSAYGTKLIAAGLLASGYEHAYTHSGGFTLLPPPTTNKGNRFATLTSTSMFEKPIGINFRRQLFKSFNARPDNVYGDNIRIVLLDSGFREGVDLFDVKYVHLFEPIITASDEKQAIGRATRYCGQKGLKFDRTNGWPLHVYKYETIIPEHIQTAITSNIPNLSPTSFFDAFMHYSNIDPRKMTFARELIGMAAQGAIDKKYTSNIHHAVPAAASTTSTTRRAASAGGLAEPLAKYTWPKVKMENICNAPMTASLSLTPTQEFIKDTFTPDYNKHGMLLVHSVGTGKTCTAIAMASSSFEAADYTIIYVTRYTLKADVWKNMFEQVCSFVVKDYLASGKQLPADHAARMRIISRKWLDPCSYKQFSNMLSNKSQMYDSLVKMNGQKDILKKTLVIIDEAHKLFADDVEGQEKADVDAIRKAFNNSYEQSGKDSVKVVFMTATPYTSEPMDMIRLLNLLRPKSAAIPDTFEEFGKKYLNESGSFSDAGKNAFLKEIDGYISYLNREKDMRSFAYPVMHAVRAPMSEYEYKDAIETYRDSTVQLQAAKADYDAAKASQKEGLAEQKKEGMVKIQAAYDSNVEAYKRCMADTKTQANGKVEVERRYKEQKERCVNSKKKCQEDPVRTDCQTTFKQCNALAMSEKDAHMKQVRDFQGTRKGECKTLKEQAEESKKLNTKELNDLIKATRQKREENLETMQRKYKELVASDKKAKGNLLMLSKDDISQLTGLEQCFAKSNSKYRTMAMSLMNLNGNPVTAPAPASISSDTSPNPKAASAPILDWTPSPPSEPVVLTAPPELPSTPSDEEASLDEDEEDTRDVKQKKPYKPRTKSVYKATLKKLNADMMVITTPLFGERKVIPDNWQQVKARLLHRIAAAQEGRKKSRVLSQIVKDIRFIDHIIEHIDTAPEKLIAEHEEEDMISIKKYNVYTFEKRKYNLHASVHGVIPVDVQSIKYKACSSKSLAAKVVKLFNRKQKSRLVKLPKTSAEWVADATTFDKACRSARAWRNSV